MTHALARLAFALGLILVASATAAKPLETTEVIDTHTKCPKGTECGTVARPLDPSGHVPGTLQIPWRLYKHTGPNFAGTILAQEGGPGYPTSGSHYEYLLLFGPMRDRYDILMVDARGTGRTAISCPSLDTVRSRTPRDVGACGGLLGPKSVLYGTRLAAQDLKAVLDHLGITEVNYYGDSYGTFFGQVFTALYPNVVRSVVLDGAFPVIGESPWYPHAAEASRHGFRAACARSPACAHLPGETLDRIAQFLQYLRENRFRGVGYDAEGAKRHVDVGPGALGLMLFGGSGPLVFRDLDPAIRAFFDDGDKAPLLRLAAEEQSAFDPGPIRSFSYGLFAAVSCMDYQQIYNMNHSVHDRLAEMAQAVAQKQAEHPNIYSPLTIQEFRQIPIDTSVVDLCEQWPVSDPPYPPGQPIPPHTPFTQAPTLVINGEFDTLTPVGDGDDVAARFPNVTHVIVANSFHVDAIYDMDDCAQAIVRRFIDTLNPGDTSCAPNVKEVRVVPKFVRHASDANPADATSGNTATTYDLAVASAAVQTAGDVMARWWLNGSGKGVGLRGGTWSYVGFGYNPKFTLTNVKWTEDLPVSGKAEWDGADGAIHATLTYTDKFGEAATVTATWNDRDHHAVATLRGTVGNRTINATMPAP